MISTRLPLAVTLAVLVAGCGRQSHSTSSPTSNRSDGSRTSLGPVKELGAGWPALLHGPSHFGASTQAGPQAGHIRWRRSLEDAIVPGPVITAAGVAYVASNAGVLHALDIASGKDRWRFSGGGSYGSDLSTAPLVLADRTIVWPGPRHLLFALTPNGHSKWTLAGGADLLTPLLDRGQLVAADQSGRISGYRLPPGHGSPKSVWSHKLAGSSFGNPVVAGDGTIYETAGNSLFALSPRGAIKWHVDTPNLVETSPAVAEGGVVVFGSNDRIEYGVNPDGTVRWRAPIGDFTYSSPLTLPHGRVIFGNHSGQMSILDSATGHLISRDQGRGQLWTSAAVDARGDVYFASRSGEIFGFDQAGRRLFDLREGGTFDSYPALAADGTLLIGGDNGTLYAIR